MIDIATEKLLSIPEAVEYVHQLTGRSYNKSTVWGWIQRGVKPRRGGVRVYLDKAPLGGTIHTSKEAIQRFTESLVEAQDAATDVAGKEAPAKVRKAPNRSRLRELSEKKSQLQRAGF